VNISRLRSESVIRLVDALCVEFDGLDENAEYVDDYLKASRAKEILTQLVSIWDGVGISVTDCITVRWHLLQINFAENNLIPLMVKHGLAQCGEAHIQFIPKAIQFLQRVTQNTFALRIEGNDLPEEPSILLKYMEISLLVDRSKKSVSQNKELRGLIVTILQRWQEMENPNVERKFLESLSNHQVILTNQMWAAINYIFDRYIINNYTSMIQIHNKKLLQANRQLVEIFARITQ